MRPAQLAVAPAAALCALLTGFSALAQDPGLPPAAAETEGSGAAAEHAAEDLGANALTVERDRVFRWLAMPFVLYEPETDFQFGVFAGLVWRPASFPTLEEASTFCVSGIYTLRRQVSFNADAAIYVADGRWYVENDFAFEIYNDDFWGIGPDAYGEPETFSFHGIRSDTTTTWAVARPWSVAFEHRFRWYETDAVEDQGRLDSGEIEGDSGDIAHGIGVSGILDRRDRRTMTRRGTYLRATTIGFARPIGSERQFARFELDARGFLNVWRSHVVAGQLVFVGNTGTPGFQSLAKLGGSELLRGIYEGRWRDRLAWVAQAEYRAHLVWRIGAVAFGGIGDVAHDFAGFGPEPVKWSAGGGLRVVLSEDEGIAARIDVGYTPREVGFYVALGEAF